MPPPSVAATHCDTVLPRMMSVLPFSRNTPAPLVAKKALMDTFVMTTQLLCSVT